ncbi:hypothetical protein [Komagataeibacter sp. FNDCF1]|uniref:hypothetical protein n=1 Tax=Komagataeibacter sp. FNDCF1 TaxID=2878681 RepID=UPI001E61C98B|nr:hypothetical protein [Komagataeibacter sp. FNDCF1]MCE2563060.1 hypothetical protein [Komagataeibacter sp. FNDCF1]
MRTTLRARLRSLMLVAAGLLAVATTLGACGRIGPPHQPSTSHDYYRTYPSRDR